VYNPQLVLHGLSQLARKRITPGMCASPAAVRANLSKFLDPNQTLSLATMHLGKEYPQVQTAMLRLATAFKPAVVANSWDTLEETNASAAGPDSDASESPNFPGDFDPTLTTVGSELSYLYYTGLLTRAKTLSGTPDPAVPNLAVQQSYFDKLLATMRNLKSTVQAFLKTPSVASLDALLAVLIVEVPPVDNQCEADLQGLLSIALRRNAPSGTRIALETHPTDGNMDRMDLLIETASGPKLVVELKTVAAFNSPRSLKLREKLPRGGELAGLACSPGGTVGNVHQAATIQAWRYQTALTTAGKTGFLVFVVTQVVDRFLVTQVTSDPAAEEVVSPMVEAAAAKAKLKEAAAKDKREAKEAAAKDKREAKAAEAARKTAAKAPK
jgi:hypothetical protein